MKFPVLWPGLCCYTEAGWGGKCSEILATIKLLYNPRVNKVFTVFTHVLAEETTVTTVDSVVHSLEQLGAERMIE